MTKSKITKPAANTPAQALAQMTKRGVAQALPQPAMPPLRVYTPLELMYGYYSAE